MSPNNKQSIYEHYEPGFSLRKEPEGKGWWFVFSRGQLLVCSCESNPSILQTEHFDRLELEIVRQHYLGLLDEVPCFCAEVSEKFVPKEAFEFREIRTLFGIIADEIYLLAGRALQILNWDRTHQFCGQCGEKTEIRDDEWARECSSCGLISYPRLSPAIIVAVVRDGKILLARSGRFREGMYSVLAGFVEPGETLEDCVKREVMEEVGIGVDDIQYFSSQPWPYPHSLMIGFTARYQSGEIVVDNKEIEHAEWFDPKTLPPIPSPLSISRELIDWYLENNGE